MWLFYVLQKESVGGGMDRKGNRKTAAVKTLNKSNDVIVNFCDPSIGIR